MADGVHNLTDSELHLPPQIRSFFWFHVYFTIRRLLFELGGIQKRLHYQETPYSIIIITVMIYRHINVCVMNLR